MSNLSTSKGLVPLKLSILIIYDTRPIASPPSLPTKAIKLPIINVKIINKARIFQKTCTQVLKMHLQQQQLVQDWPEHMHIKSINTAKATLITIRPPNTIFTPIFPYLSIYSE